MSRSSSGMEGAAEEEERSRSRSIMSFAAWKPLFAVGALVFFAAAVVAGARFVVVALEDSPTGRGGLKEGPFRRAAAAVAFFGGIVTCSWLGVEVWGK